MRSWRHAKPGGRRHGRRLTDAGWRRPRSGSRRRVSPVPTSWSWWAHSYRSTPNAPADLVEAAVDEIGMRLTAQRAAHQREGHERFTLDRILAEEIAVLDLVDACDPRAMLWVKDEDTAGLSGDQQPAVENIAAAPWLVCPLSAPAEAGKTTSMRAPVAAAHRSRRTVVVVAPTGKAVDVAVVARR